MTSTDASRTVRVVFHTDEEACVDEFADAVEQDAAGWTIERVPTSDVDEVHAAATQAVEDGVGAFASVGGDGSANLVLDELAGSDVPLLYVPNGTVNLTAHRLGISTVRGAAQALGAGSTIRLDLGVDGDEHFAINASSGYDANVIGGAEDHSDAMLGRLRFATEAVKQMRDGSARHVVVEVDGSPFFDGDAMSVVVMNTGQRGSPTTQVAPDADVTDGRLDLAIVLVDTLARAAKVVTQIAAGRDVDEADIERIQCRSVSVRWDDEVATQRDGDGTEPRRSLDYRVDAGAIAVFHTDDVMFPVG